MRTVSQYPNGASVMICVASSVAMQVSTALLRARYAAAPVYEHDGQKAVKSINFITSHDGFALCDLVPYAARHNESNGEHNHDGAAAIKQLPRGRRGGMCLAMKRVSPIDGQPAVGHPAKGDRDCQCATSRGL